MNCAQALAAALAALITAGEPLRASVTLAQSVIEAGVGEIEARSRWVLAVAHQPRCTGAKTLETLHIESEPRVVAHSVPDAIIHARRQAPL